MNRFQSSGRNILPYPLVIEVLVECDDNDKTLFAVLKSGRNISNVIINTNLIEDFKFSRNSDQTAPNK